MNRTKAIGIALASVLLGGGALAIAGYSLASATPHQSALNCVPNPSQAGHCTLTLSTYPDSLAGQHGKDGGVHPNWVSYSNSNLSVPANTTVDVVINQYDGGGSLNNPFFDQVMGTVGNTASFDGVAKTHVDPTNVGHTFTLRGYPGIDGQSGKRIFVNVPLPANPGTDTPVTIGAGQYPKPLVVTFSFKTGSKGEYEWNCEYPCGSSREGQFGYAMSSFGYMSGTLTVQ
jgi:hypothetical protein